MTAVRTSGDSGEAAVGDLLAAWFEQVELRSAEVLERLCRGNPQQSSEIRRRIASLGSAGLLARANAETDVEAGRALEALIPGADQ